MTEDLNSVIEHVLANYHYSEIYLLGFSIGGNIVLKYLGEQSSNLNSRVKAAVVISVPLDLQSSATALAKPAAQIYMRHLMSKLAIKLGKNLSHIKSFHQYDNLYTAPQHGFKDAYDYWEQASSKKLLNFINIPTLIISALDDPFLGPECFPHESSNAKLHLKLLKHGGHVGFMRLVPQWLKQGYLLPRIKIDFQCEQYVLEFLTGENK